MLIYHYWFALIGRQSEKRRVWQVQGIGGKIR